MRYFSRLLLAVILLYAVNCNDWGASTTIPPRASFKVEGNTYTGGNVKFNNTTVNADNYQWEFGDGKTSTLKDPVHTYQSVRSYYVELTAKNEAGTDHAVKLVYIEPSEMIVKKVTISSLPTKNSDPFVNFYISRENSVDRQQLTDAMHGVSEDDLPVSWDISSSISRKKLEQKSNFEIADYNSDAHSIIGYASPDNFVIIDRWGEGTPSEINLQNGSIKVSLSVKWK